MNLNIAEKTLLLKQDFDEVYAKGKTDGAAEGYESGYTEGYDAGYAEGEASGGGGSDFPVAEFFSKTAEELDLAGVTVLGAYSIYSHPNLKKLFIPDVESLGVQAIGNCNALESLTFPASLKSIATLSIMNCSALATVTFGGTPESINGSAFVSCPNLKTINVPWLEGAGPAGEPYGAINAKFNYGYVKGE